MSLMHPWRLSIVLCVACVLSAGLSGCGLARIQQRRAGGLFAGRLWRGREAPVRRGRRSRKVRPGGPTSSQGPHQSRGTLPHSGSLRRRGSGLRTALAVTETSFRSGRSDPGHGSRELRLAAPEHGPDGSGRRAGGSCEGDPGRELGWTVSAIPREDAARRLARTRGLSL